jgi:HK97 family phage prohead protease
MSVRSEQGGFERRMSGELRIGLEGDRKIRGTAVAFNSLSLDLGGFREIIKPEAVDRTLREGLDVRALVDHDSGKIIGRIKAGTLSLQRSRRGLEVVIDPPNTSYARDLIESVERGDISGMSFGFRVAPGGEEWRQEDGEHVRYVTDMTISEVSVVGFPAYPATDVQVAMRSLQNFQQEQGGSRLEYLKKWHKTQLAR